MKPRKPKLTPIQRAILNVFPRAGSGISSVTITCGDHEPITLTQEDGIRVREQFGVSPKEAKP